VFGLGSLRPFAHADPRLHGRQVSRLRNTLGILIQVIKAGRMTGQTLHHRADGIRTMALTVRQNLADFAADAVIDLMAHELRRRENITASSIAKLTPVNAV